MKDIKELFSEYLERKGQLPYAASKDIEDFIKEKIDELREQIIETLEREKDMEKIKIKYFDKEIDKLEKISKGDLIDLRSAETVEIKAGEYKLIRLGVGMKLPEGYKANVYPRSSTYKNFGIIQANSVGQIDNSYSGNEDEWRFPAVALRDTVIHKNDRICQFEIQKVQPEIEFEEVDNLDEVSRGGIGSTGVK